MDARYCQLQNLVDLWKLSQYTRKSFGEYGLEQNYVGSTPKNLGVFQSRCFPLLHDHFPQEGFLPLKLPATNKKKVFYGSCWKVFDLEKATNHKICILIDLLIYIVIIKIFFFFNKNFQLFNRYWSNSKCFLVINTDTTFFIVAQVVSSNQLIARKSHLGSP